MVPFNVVLQFTHQTMLNELKTVHPIHTSQECRLPACVELATRYTTPNCNNSKAALYSDRSTCQRPKMSLLLLKIRRQFILLYRYVRAHNSQI